MLGTLRLLLALMVALSHADVRWRGLNPGVIAVVGFYGISGYVMTGLLRRHYAGRELIPRFYADRALRLLPAYYVMAAWAFVWYLWHGPVALFLVRAPEWRDLWNHLLVVPHNYFMWNDADHFVLIPPAWSLGCEIQFYLLFPLILLSGWRMPALILSLAVYLAAFTGRIPTEWFGYRLLPGVLFIFLLGSWLADLHHRGHKAGARCLVAGVLAAIGLMVTGGAWAGKVAIPYNPETLIGLALSLPLLQALAARPAPRWDDKAGELSYGLFLCHFPVFWLWPGADQGALALLSRLGVALVLAWALHRYIDAPIMAWRRRLRRRARLDVSGPGPVGASISPPAP